LSKFKIVKFKTSSAPDIFAKTTKKKLQQGFIDNKEKTARK